MKTPLFPARSISRFAQTAAQTFASVAVATGLMSWSLTAQAAPQRSIGQLAARNVEMTKTALPDGVYLYGQSSKPDQVGKAYFVFESRQGKLIGALYMPRSSFDCTYGTIQPDKMALTVVDSFEKTENPYAIALERNMTVATNGNPVLAPVGLQGFHPIANISDNDKRILNVCTSDLQRKVWK